MNINIFMYSYVIYEGLMNGFPEPVGIKLPKSGLHAVEINQSYFKKPYHFYLWILFV